MASEFNRILALLRKERGITQKQAAADLGISQAQLSHYEKGIRECSLAFVVQVADYYGVSCDYLLGRSADRSGQTISVADLRVPVLVQACDDENDKVDLDSRRDAFCGKISVCNNLYQYGIPFTDTTLHTYSVYSPLLAQDINRFAAVCRVVNGLSHARIGQIGTRPLGFNTCRASEKLLQASGITVVPADLSEILYAAQAIEDSDTDLLKQMEKVAGYAEVPENYREKLRLQCKFGVAVNRWVEANQVDAVAIQCWDSLEQNFGCAACVTMSMLSEAGIPAACETDLAGAVSMLALTLASGEPAAIADWNNNFAENRNKCVCTHCGNFPKSFIGNDNLRLGPLGVLGRTLGKINTFGAVYAKVSAGDFTFFRISTDDTKGCIKAYVGEGKMTDDEYGMDGCIVVTEVPELQKLMKYICKNGFEHHVALVRADVAGIIEEAIDSYLGWNLYVHE